MATQQQLVIGNIPLATNIAGRISRRVPDHVDPRDLHQDACVGLLHAARRYDAAKGVPFGAYARRRIRGAVLDGLRRADHLTRDARAQIKAEGCDSAAPLHLTHPDQLAGNLLAPDQYAAGGEYGRLLAEGLDLLPARDRAVILAYYYQGKAMREIAHELGVGESRICQIRGRALLLLRKYFEKLGFISLSEVLS